MADAKTGVSLTLIRSRIGRRVALLFVLCGLVPLVLLAAITIVSVAARERDQEERRLTNLAKATAMHAYSRLLDVEDRLRFAAAMPGPLPSGAGFPGLLGFVSYGRDGWRLEGDAAAGTTPPFLGPTTRARLESGSPTLRLPDAPGRPALMIVPTPGTDTGRVGVGAEIDLVPLMALDESTMDDRGTRRVCLVAAAVAIACTDGAEPRDVPLPAVGGGKGAGIFTTRIEGDEWVGAYWSAPMQAQYSTPPLTGVVVTRATDAIAPSRDFLRTVALVTVAALCLALLASFRQIRRLLDPIARLEAATTRIAQGDYQTRVDVRTGDEIQQLGEAFNGMAHDIQRHFDQLRTLSVGTLEALARAIDAKSPWTAGHSTRVARFAVATARTMGYDAPSIERIGRGALLHDIGKIGLSADILDRPGPLSSVEMALVREHPAVGARILEPLPHCADILPIVLQHHERLDGRGYPAGLAGDAIALDARIVAVADVYDAMTSRRPYREGVDPRDALTYLLQGRGSHFDGAVVDAFARTMEHETMAASVVPVPDELIA
jgi:putative nucleotidyltransferase with HDIG domain